MRFLGLLCGIRAKICSDKTWFKFVIMSAFNIPIPFRTLCWLCLVQSSVCPYFGILAELPLPQEGGEVRAAALDLLGASPLNPVWFSTVCLTHKFNYSIIRRKMQVKFSGENHGFLWQNVKRGQSFTSERKNVKISIAQIRKELRL